MKSKMRRWRTAWIGLAVVCVSACDNAPAVSNGAHNLILTTAPSGFTVVLDKLQTDDAAAAATPANPKRTAAQLKGDDYLASWARTWVSGADDLEILEYAFGDNFHSRDFVHFELLDVGQGTGVMMAPHPTVPDSTIFTFAGSTRANPHDVFCQGSWFVVVQYAFEVTDCAPTPRFPELMVDVTQKQYLAATSELGIPAELVSPSPSSSP